MNLQHIRYALEIARTGSISKAAENLSVAQPNISRAVKELETGLGIAVFERTRTGMSVTPDGERLLAAGERILREVGELETMFDGDAIPRESLGLVFPHADYIAHALAAFTRDLPTDGRYDLNFREIGVTDALGVVNSGECRLGILRFPAHNERFYTDRLAERELAFEPVATFPTVAVTAAVFPTDAIGHRELDGMFRLADASDELHRGDALPPRRLTVISPSVTQEILRADKTTYRLSLPLPPAVRATFGLRQYTLADADMAATPAWQDVLIYPKYHKLSALDRRLLTALQKAARDATV